MRKCKSEKGFTLAELLIVIAIIAVLTGVAIPVFNTSLDRAGRAVDMSNARSIKSLLAASYLDGTVQFPSSEYEGSPTALIVYATRDSVSYFGTGDMLVDGNDWNGDGGVSYKRVKTLIANAGLDGLTVHCKNTDGTGWDYCAVILYSDGTVRIAGDPGSLNLPASGDNFEEYLQANLPTTATNLEKAMFGGST